MLGKVLIPQQDVTFRNAHHQITITVYCFYTESFAKQQKNLVFLISAVCSESSFFGVG